MLIRRRLAGLQGKKEETRRKNTRGRDLQSVSSVCRPPRQILRARLVKEKERENRKGAEKNSFPSLEGIEGASDEEAFLRTKGQARRGGGRNGSILRV